MHESRFFKVVWYMVNDPSKHVIVFDKHVQFAAHVQALIDAPCLSFYVTTHNTMPKET